MEVPTEAFEVVRFCNCLPLTIGMAGKLVHEIRRDGLMEGELDWGASETSLSTHRAPLDSWPSFNTLHQCQRRHRHQRRQRC